VSSSGNTLSPARGWALGYKGKAGISLYRKNVFRQRKTLKQEKESLNKKNRRRRKKKEGYHAGKL